MVRIVNLIIMMNRNYVVPNFSTEKNVHKKLRRPKYLN